MNKGNKILLAILSFVVVCVVGYALFGENITVTGTAKAEGTFDIGVSCVTGFSSDFLDAGLEDGYVINIPDGGYKNDSCEVNGFNVSFKTNLDFPGASRKYTIKVTNNGTIAARVPISEDARERKERSACIINSDGTKSCSEHFKLSSSSATSYDRFDWGYLIKKTDGSYVISEDDLVNYIDLDTEEIILEPGYSTYFLGQMDWPEEYTADLNGKKEANVELSVKYYFDITQAVK